MFILLHPKYSAKPSFILADPKDLRNNSQSTPPPLGANQKLYCGYAHTLAIKTDSTLWVWGNNNQGQIGNGGFGNVFSPVKNNNLTSVIDAAGGFEHSLALKGDGTVWSWGVNFEGQLGDGTLTQRTTPVKVGGGLTNITNVIAGYNHSLAIKSDSTLWSWGANTFGQLGNGNKFNSVAAGKVAAITGVTDAGGGEGYSVALKSNGTIWTWGTNVKGELGDGTFNQRNLPAQVNGITATTLSAGRYHILVLKADGTVWAWGYNNFGQLGNGNTVTQNVPVKVSGLTDVVAIAAGEYHSLAVKSDGTVWAWGKNENGQLGNGNTDGNAHAEPSKTSTLTSGSVVGAGTHSMSVKSDGSVWAWGSNGNGQYGNATNTNATTPQISLFSFVTIVRVARPLMSPDGGAYVNPQTVTISCSTAGATIYYTTNGVDPSTSDPVIASGSTISIPAGTKIVKARGFKTGLESSEIKAAVYQVGRKITGFWHSLAIRTDSTLWAWGYNNKGQIGNNSTGNSLFPVQVDKMTTITDAAAGFEHSLALKSNGTVWSWGRNAEAQLGDGTLTLRTTPGEVPGLNEVVNVASGFYHSLAIKTDGTLWSWGQNNYGQLGNGNTFSSLSPIPVSTIAGVTDAAGGDGYSVALKSDGTVYTWGRNIEGQLGDGTLIQKSKPAEIYGFKAIAVAAGGYHILALKADGTIWAWGSNRYGQLGTGNTSQQNAPVQVGGLSNIIAIAAGENHSLAVKSDGSLWAWGYNWEGQLGNGTTDGNAHTAPVQIESLTSASMVSAGTHSIAVKNDGSVWAWGNNSEGQYGNGTKTNAAVPILSLFTFSEIVRVARPLMSPDGGAYINAQKVTISSTTSGATIHYTTNGLDPTSSDPVIVSGAAINISSGIKIIKAKAFKTGSVSSHVKAAVYQVSEKVLCSNFYTLAVKSNGALWAWGFNDHGQLGNTGGDIVTPVPVNGITNVRDAAAGYQHSLAVKSNGTVWSWGRNSEGQLGDGTITHHSTPAPVLALTNIINVAAGYYHSLAVKSDGTVWSWGMNTQGQLGNGDVFNSNVARQVSNLSGVIDAAGGDGYSAALKNDGTIWTWGNNTGGQLGDGSIIQKNTPVKVNGLTAIALAAGGSHMLALKSDGTVWAWGNNTDGQLGNLNTNVQLTPVQVLGLSNVVAIAAGLHHSIAIKADGSLWSWGRNDNGQLGLGNTTLSIRIRPEQVLALSGVSFATAGSHTMAITPRAGIHLYYGFGNNSSGQIGDSTLMNRSTRVLVHFPLDENANNLADWKEYPGSIFSDADQDGLTDWQEIFIAGTDPYNFDVNKDVLSDGINYFIGLGPKLADTDGDGILNTQEILNGTSPVLADSDGDGVTDNLDAFPLDRFRDKLPPANPSDHTPPVITLINPF